MQSTNADPNESMDAESSDLQNDKWKMNYLEAAIFLEEGENNDKFDSHPKNQDAIPAYMITHNAWFYTLDLIAAMILVLLTLVERPALKIFENIPVGVHSSVELLALSILGISIALQIRWLGWRTFLSHKRSLSKALLWLIMVIEAFSVLLRDTSHFRVTRALRPIFFVDNRYFGGVRRFLRQIIQSLPPILEVLGLLFFTLMIFAMFGFYFFNSNGRDPYFDSFYTSFVSLYVLLTTANFPDVMMPSYAKNRWSAVFFIAYLAIVLYFIMNLMLAIVFVEFSLIEKDKFRKLLLHKREACQRAFQLLISHSRPNEITFKNFEGLVQFYRPKSCRLNRYLLFKVLNKSRSRSLYLKEFYNIYDAMEYHWKVVRTKRPWFHDACEPFKSLGSSIRRFVESKAFSTVVYCVIIVSALIIVVRMVLISSNDEIWPRTVTWDQIACIAFYVVEMALKMIGFGFEGYFSSGWNVFDFFVITIGISCVVVSYLADSFLFVLILRPLRLLQLFKIRRRYNDIFQTLSILMPRILSTVIVIFVIYFFFAIIGMELFSTYDMRDCCVNTTVEQYYKVDNDSIYANYYYLNNFETILISGVTLFELTVVNNWFIIMEGYASVAGEWSRLFFMVFYLVMMVVLAIVVAFIIEAFTFRKGYNEAFQDSAAENNEDLKLYVTLSQEELSLAYKGETNVRRLQDYAYLLNQNRDVKFEGSRRRTKVVLQRRMYNELISSWLNEHNSQASMPFNAERRSSSILDAVFHRSRSPLLQSHSSIPSLGPDDDDNLISTEGINSSSDAMNMALDDDEPLIMTESVSFDEVIDGCTLQFEADENPFDVEDRPFFPSTIISRNYCDS